MIDFDFSEFGLDEIEKELEVHVRKAVDFYVVNTYNHIVTHDYPYWSGAYINSWVVGIGQVNSSFTQAPKDWRKSQGRFSAPAPMGSIESKLTNPYLPVYISNSAPHASMVENIGTPSNQNQPWKIATSAFFSVTRTNKFMY